MTINGVRVIMVIEMKTDIYTLAHEIKNPLCVVNGYLEMMNSSNFAKCKEIIKKEVDTSIGLLNNYLEYNRISIQKEEIDLNLLILDIKDSMFDYLKKKNVCLKTKLLDEEIYLEADYDKLKQVFYNIIKNSVESCSRNIEISYHIMFDRVEILIKDDGMKIDVGTINKIGNNYTNKILGNGIGMTLSKKIIKLHNGKIKYKNNDKGVSVIITLYN